MTDRHLVAVWNPSYATDALDAHAQVLLTLARNPEVSPEDVYVWWGKVRSPNRQQPLAHQDEIVSLAEDLAEGEELHLYLTDYRSLYVANVESIVADSTPASDAGHVPAYYAREGLACDFWLELLDIRALVIDDTLAVQAELRHLRNVHYNDRPVSLYGGMVDLPLVVTRPDGALFFTAEERALLNDGRRWVEAESDRHGLGGLMADLRDNLFGYRAWMALVPQARTFVATGERLMRDHLRDAVFDFSAVLVELSKALEVQVSTVLAAALKDAPAAVRHANVNGTSIDLARPRGLSLAQLAHVIAGDKVRAEWLVNRLERGSWFAWQLPPMLDELSRHRNPAAHSEPTSREVALPLRDSIVGVGRTGILNELTMVQPKRR